MKIDHPPIPHPPPAGIEQHLSAAYARTPDPATLAPGSIARREWTRLRRMLTEAYLLAERLQGHDRARIDAVLGRDRR